MIFYFLTETWLCDNSLVSYFFNLGFTIHQRNRQTSTHGWGGSAILVKCAIPSNQIEFSHPDVLSFDLCCVDIVLFNCTYRLFCIYRQPGVFGDLPHDSLTLCNCISALLSPRLVSFLAGDFNLPSMDWDLLTGPVDGVHNVFLDLFTTHCLHQLSTKPTRGDSILDLFLTCTPSFIVDCSLCDALGSSDHDSLLVTICLPCPPPPRSSSVQPALPPPVRLILWTPSSVALAQEFISNFNWSPLFDIDSSPLTVWNNFCSVLSNCINMFARVVYRRTGHCRPRRHNLILKHLFHKKAAI